MHMRANKYKEQEFLRLRPSIDTERLDQLGLVSHEAPGLGEMTSGSKSDTGDLNDEPQDIQKTY